MFFDSVESTPAGNKIEVDSDARWPNVYVPTGSPFDFIIRDFDGGIISQAVNVPNPDPAPEAAPTPATFVTGMTVFMETDTQLSLWVRQNGGTIGSLASGGTERANADCEDLYAFVWENSTQETNPVAGGIRGASAFADFSADLAIQLVDKRGAVSVGLDGMGQPAGGFFTDVAFTTGDATQPGSLAGVNSAAITVAQLPAHTHGFGTLTTADENEHTHGVGSYSASTTGSAHGHGVIDPNHVHPIPASSSILIQSGSTGIQPATNANQLPSSNVYGNSNPSGNVSAAATGISINAATGDHSHPVIGASAAGSVHNHDISGATASSGGGESHSSVSRAILGTWFQKL